MPPWFLNEEYFYSAAYVLLFCSAILNLALQSWGFSLGYQPTQHLPRGFCVCVAPAALATSYSALPACGCARFVRLLLLLKVPRKYI